MNATLHLEFALLPFSIEHYLRFARQYGPLQKYVTVHTPSPTDLFDDQLSVDEFVNWGIFHARLRSLLSMPLDAEPEFIRTRRKRGDDLLKQDCWFGVSDIEYFAGVVAKQASYGRQPRTLQAAMAILAISDIWNPRTSGGIAFKSCPQCGFDFITGAGRDRKLNSVFCSTICQERHMAVVKRNRRRTSNNGGDTT